jgi:DNA-binding NtrC family response regulator
MQTGSRKKILVVDDEQSICESLRLLLKGSFEVFTVSSGEEAVNFFEKNLPDIVFLDVNMPGAGGLETLKSIRARNNQVPVVMLTGSSTISTAVAAMKLGACDFISKPFDVDHLTSLIIDTLTIKKSNIPSKTVTNQNPRPIIGDSVEMQEVHKKISRVAPYDTTVAILGESGTGKELVARKIHDFSSRKSRPFVAVNCAAIPESLIESELFGHIKGAFTGAVQDRAGYFQQANQGTIFLDEISELQPGMQVKLLRLLQEREFYPVGAQSPVRVDVRIIAASNRDLEKMVREGKFREDLFYRINVVHLELPPLRSRSGDLEQLLSHFSNIFTAKFNKNLQFSAGALDALRKYSWPGNVRELENTLESIYALVPEGVVEFQDLSPKIRNIVLVQEKTDVFQAPSNMDLLNAGKKFEAEVILKALQENNFVQTKAAKLLGISRRMLKYKMDKLGIKQKD